MQDTLTGLPLQDVVSYSEPTHDTQGAPPSTLPEEPPTWAASGEPVAPATAEPIPWLSEEMVPPISEAAAPPTEEPVLIEDKAPPPFAPRREATTLIFRAPSELIEPIWEDETAPPPALAETGAAAEPQLEN